MIHPANHPLTGKPDKRYKVQPEYCGHREPQFVIRFCEEWITSRASLDAAIEVCRGEARRRWESL